MAVRSTILSPVPQCGVDSSMRLIVYNRVGEGCMVEFRGAVSERDVLGDRDGIEVCVGDGLVIVHQVHGEGDGAGDEIEGGNKRSNQS